MVPRRNPQVVAQGLAWLTWQFQQPNIRAWLAVLLQPFQDLEDATWDVLTQRFLASAPMQSLPETNVVFDAVGELVGEPRNGMSDYDYKSLIYLKIAVNRSTGAAPNWSRFGQILLQTAGGPVGYWGDQSGILFTVSDMALNPYVVGAALSDAVPNGQHGVFSYTTWADGADQAFGSVYDATAGQQGYSSVYDTSAGGGVASGVAL